MDIRKKFLSAQLFLFAFCASAYAGWTPTDGLRLKSPDKKIEISVNQDADGLFYMVKKGKTSVLDKSPLGIIVDGNDLGKGVSFVDEPEITKIDEEEFEEVAGDADTLAGLLLELKGEFPALHEKVTHGRYDFEVLEMDNRRILKVKLTINPPAASHAAVSAS